MHQIRVHMTSIGHPIVGDGSYGNRATNRNFLMTEKIERQLLHAWKLTFLHPKTGETITIEAPLPEDMKRVISRYFPGLVALEAL